MVTGKNPQLQPTNWKRVFNAILFLTCFPVVGCGRSHSQGLSVGRRSGSDQVSQLSEAVSPSPINVRHDLGLVRAGTNKESSVVLHNSSSKPWFISELRTSCACLHATAEPRQVGIGEKCEITFSYRALADDYDDRRDVLVFSDSSSNCVARIALCATVRRPIAVRPAYPQITLISHGSPDGGGQSTTLDLAIDNYGDKDWEAVSVQATPICTLQAIQRTRHIPDNAAFPTWNARLTFVGRQDSDGALSGGDISITIEAVSREGLTQLLNVPVSVHYKRRVVAVPSQLVFTRSMPSNEPIVLRLFYTDVASDKHDLPPRLLASTGNCVHIASQSVSLRPHCSTLALIFESTSQTPFDNGELVLELGSPDDRYTLVVPYAIH